MRIYRGDSGILIRSPKYPKGRLSVRPFKIGRMRLRDPFPFSTSRKIAESFAKGTVDLYGRGYLPVLIVAEAPKVRKTVFWGMEREVIPIGTFEVKKIEVLDE